MPAPSAGRKSVQPSSLHINPWKVNTLVDGAQAKIVKMKDGRYILGILLADRSALEVELETTDRSKAEMLAVECIRLYNDSGTAGGEGGKTVGGAQMLSPGRKFREMLYNLIRESENSQE